MPIARVFPSASVLNGRIYVLGSARPVINPRPATSRVDVYDPVTDTWEQGASMPTARGDLASATVNGKIYAIGGLTGITWDDPGTVYATVEEFAPAPDAEAYLTIQKSVLLSWKLSSTDYVVESASSPEGPWTEVEEFQSQIVEDEVHMTVLSAGASLFFRLASAPLD
jgi:N-acetylneuraminic acid mutarotase